MYLNNVARAAARGVPDLFGSLAGSVEEAARFGLLADVPCTKVAAAMVKLIAGISPIAEIHGPRSCTLWLTHLLDSGIQRELRRVTPESFRIATPVPTPVDARAASYYKPMLAALEAQLAEMTRARDAIMEAHSDLHGRYSELVRRFNGLGRQFGAQVKQLDSFAVEVTRLEAHSDELRERLASEDSFDEEGLKILGQALHDLTVRDLAKLTDEDLRAELAQTKAELVELRAERAQERDDLAAQAEHRPASEEAMEDASDTSEGQAVEEQRLPDWITGGSVVASLARSISCPGGVAGSVSVEGEPMRNAAQISASDAAPPPIPQADDRRSASHVTDTGEVPGKRGPRARKIGRNARCPCGSGKKHKRCCGA